MQYGICHLSIVPLRTEPSHHSEMQSQVLYGEHFKILEERAHWCRIRLSFDDLEGWMSKKQLLKIEEEDYFSLDEKNDLLVSDLIEHISDSNKLLMAIPMGSSLNYCDLLSHEFEGDWFRPKQSKQTIVDTALMYLNVPHLWGGRSPFGIDCSALTQLAYRLSGFKLKRFAADQAKQGEPLSFIEESEAGDLAFFDDHEGIINHVGIIMKDNYILHVDEKVRIDRIDHSGIFNTELKRHTHKLRVIKKII